MSTLRTHHGAIDLIADAYRDSRHFWQHEESRQMDALGIVEALVEAGLCVDDQTGEASLEARVMRVTDDLYDRFEGQVSGEDVGVGVAVALGLATHAEAAEWNGGEV